MRHLPPPSTPGSSVRRFRALPRAIAAIAIAATIVANPGSALAKGGRETRASAPMLAVVALAEQRVTIYDAEGRKMLQAPVSTGATGLETPAGIYSVVQKKEEHHSNIYEDGKMPFMQRITWTGIALHGGVLPGYPASHGCVRMPIDFAQRLYTLTDIGLRVIIVRDDIVPIGIDHPLLVRAHASVGDVAKAQPVAGTQGREVLFGGDTPAGEGQLQALQAFAAVRAQQAAVASRWVSEAKAVAARRAAEAAPAVKALRAAEANVAKAEETLQRAERALGSAPADASAQAGQGKEKALASLAQAQRDLEAAKPQSDAKGNVAARASQDAAAAAAARDTAVEAADEALRNTSPVSVFISRKTQRLYVRQGYQPVFEGPIAIREPDRPIGTYVFTAFNDRGAGADVRCHVVSMYRNGERATAAPDSGRAGPPAADASSADVSGAHEALDRIGLTQDMRERIWQVVLPGSSLIVSDEGAHLETGKDTGFVVLMSGEPQGGIKSRRREFMARPRGDGFFSGFGFGLF